MSVGGPGYEGAGRPPPPPPGSPIGVVSQGGPPRHPEHPVGDARDAQGRHVAATPHQPVGGNGEITDGGIGGVPGRGSTEGMVEQGEGGDWGVGCGASGAAGRQDLPNIYDVPHGAGRYNNYNLQNPQLSNGAYVHQYGQAMCSPRGGNNYLDSMHVQHVSHTSQAPARAPGEEHDQWVE